MAAEAVLRIRVEGGSEVDRALNVTRDRARAASQAQNAEARRAAKEQERAVADVRKARERAAKAAEKAEKDAIREAARAQAKGAKDAAKAEAEKTKSAERESTRRRRVAEKEAREAKRAADTTAREHARSERQKTTTAEREARRRANAESQARRGREARGRAYGERFASGAMGVASTIHGAMQSGREQRAATETTLNDALVQGMTGQGQRGAMGAVEAAALRNRVFNFARDRGIREEDLAPALEQAQSRFSLISGATDASGNRSAGARRDAIDQFLQVADLARTTGNNIGDATSFFGSLRAMGLSAEDAQVSTRQATAAGFSGSVTMGELSAQALAPLRQSIANATENLSGEARQRAIQEQTSRFVANLQLQAGVGARVGVSGNRLLGLETLFGNDAAMATVGNRLSEHFSRTGNRASLAEARAMFNTDRTGKLTNLREEYRDPTRFASAMTNLFGGDVAQFRNVMGAHGTWSHEAGGAARAINTPLVAGLANVMSVGTDALAKRNDIMNARLTDADLEAMRGVRSTEESTSLVRAQQENRDALTRNSGVLGQLSKAFADWTTQNPIGAAAAGAVGSGLVTTAAGRVGASVAGSGALTSLAATGATAVGSAGALAVGGAVVAGGAIGAVTGEGIRALVDYIAEPNATAERREYLARSREETSAFSLSGWRALAKEIRDAINDRAPSQQGAFHRANAATGTNTVPPEHRARG